MDFVVFVNSSKDNLVEQIQLPDGTNIDLSKNIDFSPMNDFVDDNFSIFYSNGVIENAKLLSVGSAEDGTPTFDYELLDDRKGDLEDE